MKRQRRTFKKPPPFISFISGIYDGGMHRDKVILYGTTKDFLKKSTNNKSKNSHVVELSQNVHLTGRGELFLFFCQPFRSQDLIGNSP